MKRLISIALTAVMLFVLMPLSAFAETDPLTYTLSDDETYYIVSDCDTSATEVVIPAEYNGLPVKEIRGGAFMFCSEVTSIEIPNSITTIIKSAFDDCYRLTSITVDKDNEVYHSVGNCLIETATKTLVKGCNNSIIPEDGSVTTIGAWSFYRLTMKNIEIPNAVTKIDEYAFYECHVLKEIEIPNSVTTIGKAAFYFCESLTSVEIPSSVTFIGDSAFEKCYYLGDIYCEVESQPEGWVTTWLDGCTATVHWGAEIANTPEEPENPEQPEAVAGDIDGNGEVEADDYILLKRVYFGMAKNVDLSICDVNSDGEVNADDYILLKRVYFGMAKL